MSEPPSSLPDIDFATFVLSLGSSALVHLGEMPDIYHGLQGDHAEAPDAAPPAPLPPDLPMAKQTIDILAMLEQKTRGNLDQAESELLSGLLYDLRVKFVDARKASGSKARPPGK